VENITKTKELFVKTAEQDGQSDRSAGLALLELEKRARKHGLSTGINIHLTEVVIPRTDP